MGGYAPRDGPRIHCADRPDSAEIRRKPALLAGFSVMGRTEICTPGNGRVPRASRVQCDGIGGEKTMKKTVLVAIMLLGAVSVLLFGQAQPESEKMPEQRWPALDDISSLRCTFTSRIASEHWEPGSEPRLNLGKDSQPLQFFIDSVDRENRKARMIGNIGSADLIVVSSPKMLHLIERTPVGGLNLLSIDKQLSDDGPRSSFRAIYSRHGPPISDDWIVAQHYGSCQMWE